MNIDIKSQLERAKELKKELEKSCNKDLKSKTISNKTRNLAQEILIKIRSILDQTMYQFFKKEIIPILSQDEIKKARVYFPLVSKKENLTSALGRSMIKSLDKTHPKIYSFLVSVQPYNKDYSWLNNLSKYANEKHIRLTPQKRTEIKRTIVTNNKGGSVSWGQGVRFGKGVSIMGAPVNPVTQNIEPTPNVESKTEVWVSFLFSDSNVNVLWLCNKSIEESEKLIKEFFSLF
ncbi:hypothetical protein GOV12_04510 [Candidatus Pacearchaeota archaeon]|nr:hypothetical protein [Candidatus Pacearchaeota archaeon]